MTDSEITYNKDGQPVTFSGPDAVNYYAAASLWSAIRLYLKTGMIPTRGYTLTRMNEAAGRYTGKTYKGRKGAEQAVEDLHNWVQAMKLALPSKTEER